jgi:cation diffusion facilitator CzcD-associated flavoprotein CzcO
MGVRLRRAGFEDFTIFDRGATVGGTWRANTYPGLHCDVPSHIYSFSFAADYPWSRRYAPQNEILSYLEECSERFGLTPHLRLNTEVTAAAFDESSGKWTLETADGERHHFDVLVTACGQLSEPDIPAIPGLDRFAGPAFHSAEWPHDLNLDGRRVAVMGTGASAIGFVPEIAPRVAALTVYQRSAPWILPKPDREYRTAGNGRGALTVAMSKAARLGFFLFFEVGAYGLTGADWVMKGLKAAADQHRRASLGDRPDLLEKTTPDTAIGCKRMLLSNDWYETLKRDNVELVTGRVERIEPQAIVGPDGIERDADVIVFGTGFQTQGFVAPMAVRGLGGRTLDDVWGERPEAFLGTTVSGFPNMFVLYGPNTNHGVGSVPYLLESQANYVIDALSRIRDLGLRYIDVKPETQAEWRREIDERSRDTVWITGCHNWYLSEEGENTNNWPGAWLEYRRRTRRLNPGHYRAAV